VTTPTGTLYRLELPYKQLPAALRGNARSGHWGPRSSDSHRVRGDVVTLARAAGLQRLTGVRHVTVQLVWAPGHNHRADAGNLTPLQKAALDALTPERTVKRRVKGQLKITHYVGIGLIPDDTEPWATELMPRIDRPPAPAGLWLDVWVEHE
jgi:hypothetical protein